MVAVLPVPLTSRVLRMLSRVARVRSRKTHADGVGRGRSSPPAWGRLALQHGAGVQLHFLRREAGARASPPDPRWNMLAGPLMVFSMPSSTSTTPGIFLMASPTRGAQSRSSPGPRRTA